MIASTGFGGPKVLPLVMPLVGKGIPGPRMGEVMIQVVAGVVNPSGSEATYPAGAINVEDEIIVHPSNVSGTYASDNSDKFVLAP